MSKKSLPTEETKIKLSITLSRELNGKLAHLSKNKSKLIELILSKHIDEWKN